jgi:AmmeMemoRadiSam system protein B
VAEPPDAPRLRAVEAFPVQVDGREVICLRDPSGVTEAVLSVPRALLPVLALFDGTRSLVDVQADIMRRTGELVLRSQLEEIVALLDAHLFLEGPRLDAERARQREAFRAAAARPAFHAGRAYAAEPEPLAAALDAHFAPPAGPGPVGPPGGVRVHGLVAPHIDFARGGPAYAWAYRALAESPEADCFLVLGTAHAGLDGHAFAASAKAYETPFGPMEVDGEVLDAFLRRAPGDPLAAEAAHRSEHSIEFQAVWLQYLRRRAGRTGAARMVPVLASYAHECLATGRDPAQVPEVAGALEALRDAMAAVPRRYCLVAGADLAHVGPRFGDPSPLGGTERARVEADDRALLAPVAAGDAAGFFGEAARQRDRNRICGLSPIHALLWLLPAGRGNLLRYGQWPDPHGMVSYASVSFEEAPGP